MRYFYDTEFIEDGSTIELISIGVVAEDGREFYAVSTDFDARRANQWVRDHVLNQLPSLDSRAWRSLAAIRADLLEFFREGSRGGDSGVELWAWVGGYDHVVLAQLWGDMSGLPRAVPRFTHELKQYWEMAGRPKLPRSPQGVHDALVDARHNLAKFRACAAVLPLHPGNRVDAGHRGQPS